MVRNYCHSPPLPFSFRRSLEMANKCKAGVMEAYDVDLNHTFDQNYSENWWWESERSKADSSSFYLLKE